MAFTCDFYKHLKFYEWNTNANKKVRFSQSFNYSCATVLSWHIKLASLEEKKKQWIFALWRQPLLTSGWAVQWSMTSEALRTLPRYRPSKSIYMNYSYSSGFTWKDLSHPILYMSILPLCLLLSLLRQVGSSTFTIYQACNIFLSPSFSFAFGIRQ